ncbi:hydrolase [Collibacillus ludicampi]|uniref:Hydrolase n=1 Tax=Collibacillus ludicampi TaxID=2771369 RepID=A0AAV4LG31_9BACL|nr:NlpC/P60 family protein [Collibacillus ludicampi]GIM46579.1 hydrolase [Collibacillus ludicampi]
MKKQLIQSLLALSFVTTSFTPVQAEAVSLRQGADNADVASLQKNLNTLGYFTYPRITGYFGIVTKEAVQTFQNDYGLQADGVVGPITRTAIQHALVKQQMMQDAKRYIGVPYVLGGATPKGFDCSGFVYFMFSSHGVSAIPRMSSAEYARLGSSIDQMHLRPGDLVFFGSNGKINHVGFYLGNRQFISATSSKGIWISSLDNPYWAASYIMAKRIY